MKKAILFLAFLLLALPLGGCYGLMPQSTGPDVSVTPSPYVNPETLIPKADAEKIVGNALENALELPTFPSASAAAEVQPAVSGMPAAAPLVNPAPAQIMTCFYEAAAEGGHFLQVGLLQTNDAMAAQKVTARMQYDALKGKGPSTTADPKMIVVSGVGDEAVIEVPGIHILFRGYYIIVGLGDPYDGTVYPNGKTNEQMLIEAGKLAVENLAAALGVPAPTQTPSETPQASPEASAQ
jgi:hypothetical protein